MIQLYHFWVHMERNLRTPHIRVYCCTWSHDREPNYMPINRWINKENVACISNGLLWVFCLHVLCVLHACLVATEAKKKKEKKRMSNSFVTEVTESYEPPHGCLGLNWGLLENQQELLTTETSLQLQFYFSSCLK